MDILFIYPAESEGFEPPIRAIRIPHFECGSFDHSDNSPLFTYALVRVDFGFPLVNQGLSGK